MAPYALVVEDDPPVADLFQRALEDAGYQAEIMDNGHKAQAHLIFTTPDLVLLDLHLPSLDGAILLRQIRSQERLQHTRVVMITGDKDLAALHAGEADGVLVKPVDYEAVRKLAEQYVNS